ncbi:gluconate 2-dehydrogenase subunit 3 family protein [Colwellia sp. MB02u-18]|uniref:gluconate 2-dehydrogenase subunit 3 family protein n=1 Tax=unclassified Colwellia TaxID=196834 RepID=UPI0015F6CDFE|nr:MULTISPECIES: gluconate 2-dehydrogenase subunit 3 family protein [unclassified Colwellia]MBA6224197.1 gluconate 2-dehydrogenase subunit 3 family protein [Colwellia sp. MB3u-45]MBA6268327.1 gluconate 2-dehydrogenase subunit 3 family protein [Colwellia sp. MB3u-43]MBA6322721.1 gluconate 2-dehydrogenase subunit 3 family protein [Colwellia sp. MB02u-19]MBA6323529.1 gluconate 2-dehydrogenase subunit 3 family protein [Colwellia sp. MB02u-18]MBA6332864.1 gluconate 2-dehydrogenase subunit 3 family 
MNRRELLKMITVATGTLFVGTNVFAKSVLSATDLKNTDFTDKDVAMLNEIGEGILPRTDTPGAKDANVGLMMTIMVTDCYEKPEREAFISGISTIKAYAHQVYNKDFIALTVEQQMKLLTTLDNEARIYNEKNVHASENTTKKIPHYFSLMKQLVLFCFFTSKIGATEVLRYVAVPGYYDGALPYKKGDKAWSTS